MPPWHELGAAAGSGLREIGLFDQRRAIAARRRFDRRGQAACAAANHQNIPGNRLVPQPLQHFRTVHDSGNDYLIEYNPRGENCRI
jgi:hypothetical protein